jgi:hypothetical protein
MKRLLERISWLTRKWNCRFELFSLQFTSQLGFRLFTIDMNHRDYSLLAFKFRLPNKTNVRYFVIDEWDILFIHNYLWQQYDDLSDSKLWGVQLSWWGNARLYFLNKLFN